MMDFNQFKQQFPQLELLQADPAIFLAPQIPMNKILGAMSYLPAQTRPEEVLVLVDETVFGHGKNGLCLTARGIYFKEVFENANFYAMKAITSVGYSMGWINQQLVISGTVKVTLAQPEKAGVRLLADFLNQYCAIQKARTDSSTSAQQQQNHDNHGIPNLQPIIKLYAYLLLGWRGEWTEQVREMMRRLFDRDFVSPQDQAFLSQFMRQNQQLDFFDILDEVSSIQDSLPRQLCHGLLEEMLAFMEKRNFEVQVARDHFLQISTALNIDQQSALAILAQFPAFMAGDARMGKQDTASTSSGARHAGRLTQEQQAACELLGIAPEQLDRQMLTRAYRIKMADFHPDQYQQLPPAVRQVIEQQAQQLNQARSCLEALLGSG
ncbi:J domain-containing protein [Acinetobacter sp. VNH17]|uniref:J domain-containing protein n=1 Tax=Acinetobacter thutiue TaxID=2998078 RepID=A0ABT7WN99_9GAMM|nr:J domain-containing protein [Acinetobacter thutiue]MCY6412051.1 J domain-containing protein [Acinetobacter thutiue]MDN0014155.1 J domain-containing protein [Acinetobacter thutiue]